VLVMGLLALLVFVAVVGASVVAVVLGQRKAQSAADLAALAGAIAARNGQVGCTVANRVAARNGADLAQCEVDGQVVLVTVKLRLPEVFAGRSVRARARAGPATVLASLDQRTFPRTLVTDMRMATRSGFTRGTL
jgi:secretion/DNA translocation related TadE-like protein